MWRQRHRKRLSVHYSAQRFETCVPIGKYAVGQKRRVGRATYAQQAKVVRRRPAYSGGRPAITAPRQEFRRLRSTARKNNSRRSRRYRKGVDNHERET